MLASLSLIIFALSLGLAIKFHIIRAIVDKVEASVKGLGGLTMATA